MRNKRKKGARQGWADTWAGPGTATPECNEDPAAKSSPLKAALDYAQRGWPVLPLCWPGPQGDCGCGRGHPPDQVGKAPLTPHGVKDATTDPDTIRTWWRKWPKANIGIALEPAGLLVLDLDSPLPARFDEEDRRGLEQAATVFLESLGEA